MKITFTKMQGAGNDYIYVDATRFCLDNPSRCAQAWSRPHFGIGSDGLVLIGRSAVADFSMRIFNADGSEARMCGNASRCIAKYVYDKGLTDKQEITLETLSGIKTLRLEVHDGRVQAVTVDMGKPVVTHPLTLADKFARLGDEAWFVNMGNPHVVVFVDDIRKIDLPAAGPLLEQGAMPEGRVNVEFVQPLGADSLRMRVWERGSGITLACGTGACASYVAAQASGRCQNPAHVAMDGGSLRIATDPQTGHVLMTGPAAFVFEGEVEEPAGEMPHAGDASEAPWQPCYCSGTTLPLE